MLAYLEKNLKLSSAESFFIAFHDFTTRASCSSVKAMVVVFSAMMLRYLFVDEIVEMRKSVMMFFTCSVPFL